jgi:RimJ/RimL family protein N-acetyltransferase
MLDKPFEQFGFKRVKLSVYTFNTVAIQCYQRLGFKVAEVIIDAFRLGSESWDKQTMILTAVDYRAVKL